MKVTSLFSVSVAVACVGGDVEAFVIGGVASSTARLARQAVGSSSSSSKSGGGVGTVGRAAAHGAGCSCISCSLASHGMSCGCPSCSSGGVLTRSHRTGCRCGSCSGVRMQAHAAGCGCGECSTTATAFCVGGASCGCSVCTSQQTHGGSCICSACSPCASRPGRRGASLLTVLGATAGGPEAGAGAGAAAAVAGLKQRLSEEPESVMFEDTMAAIEDGFDYSPKRLVNGVTSSDEGANEGSCKVFSFGKIAELSSGETLACFGEHYRGVLADPEGDSHGNIRAFMESGWDGVAFPDGLALSSK